MTFDNKLAKRNTIILATASALAGGNSVVTFATASITGHMFAPDKSLATLPVSIYVVGLVFMSLPLGYFFRQWGRKNTYFFTAFLGVLTGIISAFAVYHASFVLVCLGTFIAGCYASAVQSYRFAAADLASPDYRPKVISWVMTGGVAAAIIGPQLVIHTKDIWQPFLFLATYIGQALVAVLAIIMLSFLKFPEETAQEHKGGRPLLEIITKQKFIVAVICGIVSYMVMNFVMTAAPLAMQLCGHSVTDSSLGIQWHVLGMFAPSFFTGSLIVRYGANRVVACGLFLLFLSTIIALTGIEKWQFWSSLIFLGLGWNFGYIGATSMITQCHEPNERTRVQSFNDFCIYSAMALGSFSSGQILVNGGWNIVNLVAIPFLAIAAIALIYQHFTQRQDLTSPKS